MPEVFRLADSITVLRDGKSIATLSKDETSEDEIISLMVGRELTERYPQAERTPNETILEVKNYSVWHPDMPKMKVNDNISFSLRKGEILGIAGLMGSGRSELATSLFGAYEGKREGEVWIEGKKVHIRNVQDAINEGIALVTEDRKRFGLVLSMDVKTNTTLASLKKLANGAL